MGVLNQIQESGIGSVVLYLYVVSILYWFPLELNRLLILVISAAPSVLVVLLVSQLNDPIVKLLAGRETWETFQEIKKEVGDEEFYEDQPREVQSWIDDLDEKAFKEMVKILSGVSISISLPFVVLVRIGTEFAVYSVGLSLLIGYLIVYRSHEKLQEVITYSTKVYDNEPEA